MHGKDARLPEITRTEDKAQAALPASPQQELFVNRLVVRLQAQQSSAPLNSFAKVHKVVLSAILVFAHTVWDIESDHKCLLIVFLMTVSNTT